MRAAVIDGYGKNQDLKILENVEEPIINEDQVLVAVHAAAINPFDYKVRNGEYKDSNPFKFPAVLGGDFSGVVIDVGGKVKSLKKGEEVFGQANALSGHGSFAELVAANESSVFLKPNNVDFVLSSALPLTACSAYQALVDNANLQAGQTILIHGAAGGIGSFAVQLANYIGANSICIAKKIDEEYLRNLGADKVIDYEKEDFTESVSNVDVVFDTVGGDTYRNSFKVLKTGGTIVSMLEEPNEDLIKKYGVKALSQFTRVTQERLSKIKEFVEKGDIKIPVDRVFSLAEVNSAIKYLESGRHKGKVVIFVS